LTSHITDSLVAIASGTLWRRLSDAEKGVFGEVFQAAAVRASDQIDKVERDLPEWFKAQGKTVVVPDRAAFMAAAAKVNTDPASGAGWTKQQYDLFQSLGR
jgi:TRAP-type C4-dicarboxylate transport system substrate-binding protein